MEILREKKKLLLVVGLIAMILAIFAGFLIDKLSESSAHVKLMVNKQSEVLEKASETMVKRYLELRLTTDKIKDGNADFEDIDELAIAWEELLDECSTEQEILSDFSGGIAAVESGKEGESGVRKIAKDIAVAYGWEYPLVSQMRNLTDTIRADALTMAQSIRLVISEAEQKGNEAKFSMLFNDKIEDADALMRVNIYVTDKAYSTETSNLSSNGILSISGADTLLQIGKTNAGIFINNGDSMLITAEGFRNLVSTISEESALIAMDTNDWKTVMLGDSLGSLIQVGRMISIDLKRNEGTLEIGLKMDRLSGKTTQNLGINLIGKTMKKLDGQWTDELIERYEVLHFDDKMNDYLNEMRSV